MARMAHIALPEVTNLSFCVLSPAHVTGMTRAFTVSPGRPDQPAMRGLRANLPRIRYRAERRFAVVSETTAGDGWAATLGHQRLEVAIS